MNTRQVKGRCKTFPCAVEALYGEPCNFLAYPVGGKTFAYFKTSELERWRFSVRVSPGRFVELTGIPGVKPARYRGRFHWVAIVKVRQCPAAYLAELIECSYRKAVDSLSVAKRKSLATGV